MPRPTENPKALRQKIVRLQARLSEAEQTLDAIRSGAVDAVVVSGPAGDRIFTLKSAEHPYRILIEQMQDGAVTLAPDGTILYSNRRFAELVQTPLETVFGTPFRDFVTPADHLTLATLLADAHGQGEITLRAADGDSIPAHLSAKALIVDGMTAVCLVITDLTQHKRNEATLAAERLARSILEHATEAIIVCDPTGCIIRTSRGARRLVQGNPVGQSFAATYPLLTAPDAPIAGPDLVGAALSGQIVRGVEAELPGPDGQRHVVIVSAGPLYGAAEQIIGCVLSLTETSARKRAEEALRKSQSMLARAQSIGNIGSWEWDIQTDEVIWSEQLYRIFGVEPDRFVAGYEGFLSLVHPEDRPRVEQAAQQVMVSGQPFRAEYRIVRPDSSTRVVLAQAETMLGVDGGPLRMTGTVLDVTERKEADEALRKLNETLEERIRGRTALVSLLHDVTSAANRSETFEEALQFALRRVCEQFDWCCGHALRPAPRDPDELTPIKMFYVPSSLHLEPFRAATLATPPRREHGLSGRVLATSQSQWTMELHEHTIGPRADVARAVGLQTALAFPVIAGREVVALLEFFSEHAILPEERALSAMSDIGIQLGRVVERERAREALRQRSRQLEAFFDHSLTPFVFLDREFNFIRVNEAYARACERPVSEFPGRNHFELYPSDAKAIFDQVVRTKEPTQVIARPFSFPDHPEWGVTYWDWTLAPILNAAGEIEFLAFSLVDVTKHKQTEERLRHKERLASLGTFATGMAHEINNPLAAILMTARHGLKIARRDPAELESVLQEIVEDTQRCARIVAGVLRFARRQPSPKLPVPLASVLQAAYDQSQKYARERHVRLALRLPTQLPIVNANATDLEQVLVNLITNAAQASHARQAIFVQATPLSGRVQIRVQDHGHGMDEPTREHAFDPFFTTRAGEGGTGLGLTMVHGIVTDHGGTVQLDSRPGHGTIVTLELPCTS